MSMLAERRRKTKWSLNPTGRLWSDDKNKFGQRMLEKMGWKEGCGLGAQLQGPKEHVRVSTKNDNKGIGFKGSDEAWFKVQEDYEKFLSEMSATYGGGTGTSPSRERKSLEEISRSSRARIHYAKFIRGKDMSRYSEKDLACIFGKPLSKTEPRHQVDCSHAMQALKISEHSDTLTPHASETFNRVETVVENAENMGYVDVVSTKGILSCNDDECQNMGKKKKRKKSAYVYMDSSSELCEGSHLETCEASHEVEAKDGDTHVVGFVDNDTSRSNRYIAHDVYSIRQKVKKKKKKRKDSFDNEQCVDQNEQSIDSDGGQQRSADCIKCYRCGQIYDLSSLSGSEGVPDGYSRYHEPTCHKRKKKKLKEHQINKNNVYCDYLDPRRAIDAHSESKKKHLKKDDESLGCDNQCVVSKCDRKHEKRKKKQEFEKTSQSHDGNVSEYSYKSSSPKSKLSTKAEYCVDSSHVNTDVTNEKSQNKKYEVHFQEKKPYKKKSSSEDQGNGLIGNKKRCSSYPNDRSVLDDCNSEQRYVAEDFSKGTSSVVGINGREKNKKMEEDSFSGALQVETFVPSRHISMVDLDAFKGSNWAKIKGYGYYCVHDM